MFAAENITSLQVKRTSLNDSKAPGYTQWQRLETPAEIASCSSSTQTSLLYTSNGKQILQQENVALSINSAHTEEFIASIVLYLGITSIFRRLIKMEMNVDWQKSKNRVKD